MPILMHIHWALMTCEAKADKGPGPYDTHKSMRPYIGYVHSGLSVMKMPPQCLGMVAHTCNPSTWKAETGGLP